MNTPDPIPTPTPTANQSHPAQPARALLKEFQSQFAVFRDCMPLAIGIDKQLIARFPEVDRKVLRTALRIHTNSAPYLKQMGRATARFDLDGNAADEITDVHRAHAAETLRERFKKSAEQRKAQREAEEASRRRAEKLEQLAAKFSKRDQ